MKMFIRAAIISLVFIVLCGFIYPLGMTGVSQLLFHKQANGSIVDINGGAVGSELLGQAFTDARFFHGRVSAINYNTYREGSNKPGKYGKSAYPGKSSGTTNLSPLSGSANLAPSNPALVERVHKDTDAFLKANPGAVKEDIPTDLMTSSASGLDPHISPGAARIQIPRISAATGISITELDELIKKYTEGRQLGLFGEPRINVLKINLEILARIK